MSIATEVYLEDLGSTVTLSLTPDQYERATRDSQYLNVLVNEYRMCQQDAEDRAIAEAEKVCESVSGLPEYDETQEQTQEQEESSSFIWINSAVLLLLSLYEDHIEDFSSKRHKKVWEEIAQSMQNTNPALKVTGLQCQTKVNGLKRTYKKILDHNSKSGNDRASWPFFERMNELFGTTRWAQPLAVASERGPSTSSQVENNNESDRPAKKKRLDTIIEKYVGYMKNLQETKQRERQDRFNKALEMKEKHHREKMAILQEFLNRMPPT